MSHYEAVAERLPRGARVPAAARSHDPRHVVGGELLRLARRHAGRRAARREDRGRRRRGGAAAARGAQGHGGGGQRQGRLRALSQLPERPRLAAHRRLGRQGAAPPVGEHRHQEPGLLRRAVRGRAHRRPHREHPARGHAGRPSTTTARSRGRSTGASTTRTACFASSAAGYRHGAPWARSSRSTAWTLFVEVVRPVSWRSSSRSAPSCSPAKEADVDREPSRPPLQERLAALAAADFSERLWAADPTLWSADDDAHQKIVADALGWLDVAEGVRGEVDGLGAFVAEVRAEGFRHAVLLGMGGSSLAPEVMRRDARRRAPGSSSSPCSTAPPRPRCAPSRRPSTSAHAVRGLLQVGRHHRGGLLRELLLRVARARARRRTPAAPSSPSPTPARSLERLAPSAATAGLPEPRPTSAAATRRSRSSAWCPRRSSASTSSALLDGARAMAEACGRDVPRRAEPGRARSAPRSASWRSPAATSSRSSSARRWRPSAPGSSSWSPRAPARRARASCRWTASRSGPPAPTAPTACSSRLRLAGAADAGIAGARRARDAGHPVLEHELAARATSAASSCAGRSPPPSPGRARRGPLRRAQRAGEQGHTSALLGRVRRRTGELPAEPPADDGRRVGVPGRATRARRTARARVPRAGSRAGDYLALSPTSRPGGRWRRSLQARARCAARGLRRRHHAGLRAALPALHRPAPQGRARHRVSSCSSPRHDRRRPRDPGAAVQLRRAQARPGRGDLEALRGARPAACCASTSATTCRPA